MICNDCCGTFDLAGFSRGPLRYLDTLAREERRKNKEFVVGRNEWNDAKTGTGQKEKTRQRLAESPRRQLLLARDLEDGQKARLKRMALMNYNDMLWLFIPMQLQQCSQNKISSPSPYLHQYTTMASNTVKSRCRDESSTYKIHVYDLECEGDGEPNKCFSSLAVELRKEAKRDFSP